MEEYEDTHVVVSEREALISTVSYNIMATNDLACATVIFALFRLRKSPFYRFRVKQLANKVEYERRKYEKVINTLMADSSAKFADSNDIFMDAIQDEVDALFNSIKGEYDKSCVEDSELFSWLEMARTMCDYSCCQLKYRRQEMIAKDPSFKRLKFAHLDLNKMSQLMNELMKALVPDVDLNTDACNKAIRELGKKLIDPDIIAKALLRQE